MQVGLWYVDDDKSPVTVAQLHIVYTAILSDW